MGGGPIGPAFSSGGSIGEGMRGVDKLMGEVGKSKVNSVVDPRGEVRRKSASGTFFLFVGRGGRGGGGSVSLLFVFVGTKRGCSGVTVISVFVGL